MENEEPFSNDGKASSETDVIMNIEIDKNIPLDSDRCFGLKNAQIPDLGMSTDITTVNNEFDLQKPSTSHQSKTPAPRNLVKKPRKKTPGENIENDKKNSDTNYQHYLLINKEHEPGLRLEEARLQVAMMEEEMKLKRKVQKLENETLEIERKIKIKKQKFEGGFNED